MRDINVNQQLPLAQTSEWTSLQSEQEQRVEGQEDGRTTQKLFSKNLKKVLDIL